MESDHLIREMNWIFHVRAPQVVFLAPVDNGGELYSVNLNSLTQVRLTETTGRVYDFNVSGNGEQIVYSGDE